MNEKTKRQNVKALRGGIAIAATAVIIAAAALVILYRDRIAPDKLAHKLDVEVSEYTGVRQYAIESGSRQIFAAAGSCLAAATCSGLQMFDDSGNEIAREFFTMENPAIAAFDSGAAFFDAGGLALRVVSQSGEITNLDRENKIVTVTANKSGALAVVTLEPGYKSLVTIFNKSLNPVYERRSGSLSILSAQLSPSGDKMACLGVSETGTDIVVFSLNKEEPERTVSYAERLFFDLRYMGDKALCAISLDSLIFINPDSGAELGSYSFEGHRLNAYDLGGDGFAALLLNKYSAGVSGEIITVGTDGKPKGAADLSGAADGISVLGGELLVLSGSSLTLFDPAMNQKAKLDGSLGISAALLARKGQCLAVSSYSAEKLNF